MTAADDALLKDLEKLFGAFKSDTEPNDLLKNLCDPNFVPKKPKMIVIESISGVYKKTTFDEKKIKL